MTKSMEVHPRREVTCQELADPGSHESGWHHLRPAQIGVDYPLLSRLQNRALGTALLRSDLTLIPPADGPCVCVCVVVVVVEIITYTTVQTRLFLAAIGYVEPP